MCWWMIVVKARWAMSSNVDASVTVASYVRRTSRGRPLRRSLSLARRVTSSSRAARSMHALEVCELRAAAA